jgi:hypothetical protein
MSGHNIAICHEVTIFCVIIHGTIFIVSITGFLYMSTLFPRIAFFFCQF